MKRVDLHARALITVAGLLAIVAAAAAQKGASVLPADLFSTYSTYGAESFQVVPVSDKTVPFEHAFQIQGTSGGPEFWDASLDWNVTSDIPQNDLLLLAFWIRNLNTDLQPLHVIPAFQDNVTYNKSLIANAPSDQPGWIKYAIPFRIDELSQVTGDGSSVQIFFGGQTQAFEIGGISLLDFGQVPDPIPSSVTSQFAFYYPGRGDAQAPWKLAAKNNILQTRMADLTVNVTRDGVPVSDAAVRVDQTASAFYWGSAVDGCNVAGNCLDASDTLQYNANIVRNFNTVVLENDLKWPNWECCRQYAIDGIDFAQKNKLHLRGHNLIWPNFDTMPADCATLSPAALTARIHNHFENEEGALRGQIYEWDVVNEPYGSNQVQGLIPGVPGVTPAPGVLGNSSIADWYKWAGQIDPGTVRNMNDAGIFELKDPIQEAYDLALVRYIGSLGGSVQGFSFESHFYQSAPVFSDMQATIDDFDPYISKYGVTEFDFAMIDPSLQADLTRDYMTFIFGQPKFNEFLMWGFWDGAHWLNSAPLYNLDWSLKPSGKVFESLTRQVWQTHTAGTTNSKGEYAVRAFKGAYKITASLPGHTCTVPLELEQAASIDISLNCDSIRVPAKHY